MDSNKKIYKKSLTMPTLAARVYEREDNKYKREIIRDVIKMYFEECENALLNGENIQISCIGTLNAHVHIPKSYACSRFNSVVGNQPYTSVKYNRGQLFRDKMNNRYRNNVKNGIPGLGGKCMCNKAQQTMLKELGFLDAEKEDTEGE